MTVMWKHLWLELLNMDTIRAIGTMPYPSPAPVVCCTAHICLPSELPRLSNLFPSPSRSLAGSSSTSARQVPSHTQK